MRAMDPAPRLFFRVAAAAVFAAGISACAGKEEPRRISLESPAAAPAPASPGVPDNARLLRVAVASMISPKETFVSYSDLLKYIGKKLGREVRFVQRQKYEEVNELLRKNLIDVAFVCTGAYVEGHDGFGMDLLVAPVAYGRTVYYSYIIVPEGSRARDFRDLKGLTFAFTDPMSNTGRLAPVYRLAQMNQTPDRFFRSTTYTYSHDKSIESVARNLVDGAAVDSLVWDYMKRKNPGMTSQTRVIDRSEPFGIPPVVVSPGIDPALRVALRDLFLRIHEDAQGKEILSNIMIDRFVVVNDNIYDSVRAMSRRVGPDARK